MTRNAKSKSGRAKQGLKVKSMPKWKAWLLIGVLLFLTCFLLWTGQAVVVRCDRVQGDHVDAVVQRRFCGVINLNSTTVSDVVKADVYYVWARSKSGGRQRRSFTEAIELIPRQGSALRRNRFGPAFGTQPEPMAARINQFISESSERSVTIWWMPWLVNLAAIPFVLIVGGILGEVLLRALGLFKKEPHTSRKDQ